MHNTVVTRGPQRASSAPTSAAASTTHSIFGLQCSVHVSSPIKWAMDLLPMQYPSSTNYINRKPLSGMQIRGKNFIFNHCLPEFISWKLNDMYMHILRFCTIVTLRWQWYLKPYFMGDKGLFYPNSKKNTYRLLVTRWRNFKEPGHFDGPVVQ